jgi:hypothetical protein
MMQCSNSPAEIGNRAGARYRRWRYAAYLVLHALFCAALLSVAHAQTMSDQEAIDTGQKALRGDFPWYDAKSDQLRRIDVSPPKDLQNRHSRWQFQKPTWSWPPWLMQTIQVLFWIVFALLLLLVVYVMVRAFVSFEAGTAAAAQRSASIASGDADRVESLPFQVERPLADLLEEARRHYDAGRFGEAIIYLYSYQLVELDKHQVIRLTKGKTNRQYLREVRRRSGLGELLERTMIAFEDVFFGNHRLGRSRFESCWESLDQFHEHLQRAVA